MLSRPDALQAIRKEFDGVGSMGTWELESVDEEFRVKEAALQSFTLQTCLLFAAKSTLSWLQSFVL